MVKYIAVAVLVFAPAVAGADKKLAKSGTWDCKKDPNIHIGNGKGKYTFKGPCKTIKVGGGMNKLTIASVETLDIGGAKNTITVDTVGTIDVAGAANTITWKKALTGDAPVLQGQPEKNTITQAK